MTNTTDNVTNLHSATSSSATKPQPVDLALMQREMLLELGYDSAWLKWISFYRLNWYPVPGDDYDPMERLAMLAEHARDYPDDPDCQERYIQVSFYLIEPRCQFLCESDWNLNPEIRLLLEEDGFETDEDLAQLTPEHWEEVAEKCFKSIWESAIAYVPRPKYESSVEEYAEIPF